MRAVLKVGGSLISVALDLMCSLVEAHVSCLIVPGGGPFANTVREFQSVLDDTTAHWMAVGAMNQYGWFLSAASTQITTKINQDLSGVSVLLPFDEVYANDPLPHSWDVTSDSIAAWVAHKLNQDLVIATDVDGVYVDGHFTPSIGARAITGHTCIDAFCPSLIQTYDMTCVIVNGRYFDRVLNALNGVPTVSTTIHSGE